MSGQGSGGVSGVTCQLGACELHEDIYGCCPPCLETARMCPVASEFFFCCFKVFFLLLAEPLLFVHFFCLLSLAYLDH